MTRSSLILRVVLLLSNMAMGAMTGDETEPLRQLVSDYYRAIQKEDPGVIAALMFFDTPDAKQKILAQYQATFSALDMRFSDIEVKEVEINEDGDWATISVGLKSIITFSDGSVQKPREQGSFVLIAHKREAGWKLVKVMRAAMHTLARNSAIRRKALQATVSK